jgi:hypothetical protein
MRDLSDQAKVRTIESLRDAFSRGESTETGLEIARRALESSGRKAGEPERRPALKIVRP